jgi:hypothetical protein
LSFSFVSSYAVEFYIEAKKKIGFQTTTQICPIVRYKIQKNQGIKLSRMDSLNIFFPQFPQVWPSPLNSPFCFLSSLSFSKSRAGKNNYPHVNGENPLSKLSYQRYQRYKYSG